jgi:hypothetical protein
MILTVNMDFLSSMNWLALMDVVRDELFFCEVGSEFLEIVYIESSEG